MKKTRFLAILLCFVMVLSVTAMANWTTIGKTDNHNGVVTSAPTTSSATATEIALMNSGSGWDGVDTVPVMRTTSNGKTFAYVLYDGHAKGGHLAKIDCSASTPYTIWDKQISGNSGFQLSTPLLVPGSGQSTDAIYLASSLGDKYVLTNVSPSLPTNLSNGTAKTITASISNLLTASNRVAIGIYLGNASTQGAISTTGTASISLGLNTVNLTLSPTGTNTGTSYKTYEQPVYDASGNVVSYDYYWYINHNVTGTAGSPATVTVTITLTGGNGTVEYLDVYANQASIQKVTGLDATDAANVTNTTIFGAINGQINTPITTDGTYLYFGTYEGNNSGTYYQITKAGTLQGSYGSSSAGYYWAGAVKSGNYIYFGGDDGILHYRSASNFSNSGGTISLSSCLSSGEAAAGKIRSTIMLDNGYLYFTSQGGYLWCFQATTNGASHVWHATLGGTSTSTPTKVGNRIYVGCYGGNTKNGVQCVDISGTTPIVTYVKQDSTLPVQCSIVVKGDGTSTDYLFFVTNAANSIGAGYCYSYSGGGANSGTKIWEKSNHKTYALGGMAIDNGKVVFGNDFNYLYVVR